MMTDAFTILKQTAIIYTIIFGISTILTMAFRSTDWGRNMFMAIASWLAIFMLFLGTSYAGPIAFTCLIAIIAFLGMNEYYRLTGIRSIPLIAVATGLLATTMASVLLQRKLFFYAIPSLSLLAFFVCHIASHSFEDIAKRTGSVLVGFIYWGWMPFHFAILHRLEHGFGYIIFLCTMIAFNDNSAFYVGKFLGKGGKQFSPRISPNKTWSGVVGGFVVTLAVAMAFRFAVPYLSYPEIALLAVVIGLSIPIGDLIESAMKRDLKVKDSGSLIPGHGGVMDRFDSWIFTAPIMYWSVLFIQHLRI
jgi:phosphatidate cytidylyltransferase